MTTWADVEKGDRVELRGQAYGVEKIKGKGKRREVTITGPGGTFTSEVKAGASVTLAPLTDDEGAQTRWAKPDEQPESGRMPLLTPGDSEQRKRPHKAKGGAWDEPADRDERNLATVLGAELIAATDDEEAGWYVPPPTLDTIYAHAHIFHGTTIFDGEVAALAAHDEQHRRWAAGGDAPPIAHWHTKQRP